MQYALEVLRFKERELQNVVFTMNENYKRKVVDHSREEYEEAQSELKDIRQAIKLVYGSLKSQQEEATKEHKARVNRMKDLMKDHVPAQRRETKPIRPTEVANEYDKVYISTENPKVTFDSPKGHPKEPIILKDVTL